MESLMIMILVSDWLRRRRRREESIMIMILVSDWLRRRRRRREESIIIMILVSDWLVSYIKRRCELSSSSVAVGLSDCQHGRAHQRCGSS